MKKFLSIIALALFFSGYAYADDSYEASFKKALENNQYYFKHKGKTYTTNTKEKPFDFFDQGYNYHEASIYMKNNYTDPSDGNYGCMLYNGHLYQFQNSDQKKLNYLDYDKNGWKKTTFEKSKDGLVTAVLTEAPTCLGASNYFNVYFKGKEVFDSKPDFKKQYDKGDKVGLNINSYIDKDYNLNGKSELFIDAGYDLGGNTRYERYYFFEYDTNSIKLKKNLLADDWKKRLNISEYFQNKFSVSEEELIKVITKNFSGDTPKNYYNDYLTNCSQSSPSYSSFENADILEVEIFKGKKLDINCLVEKFENHQKKFPIISYLSDKALLPQKIIQNTEVTKSKNDNAQYVKLELSSIADQKCGETCVYTTEALLIYDDTFWYIKGNNNRGLKAILESKNKILITNFMSTHQRQYTFANNKIKRVKKKIATKKKKTKEVEIVQGYKGVLEKQVAMKAEALTKNYNADLFDLINKKDTARNILKGREFEYALSKEVNDKFIDFKFEGKDRYSFLNEQFYHLLSYSSKKAYEVDINNDDFFIVTGCADLSCNEAGLLYIDKKNKIVIGATNSEVLSNITNTDVSAIFVFTKKISEFKELPNDFFKQLADFTVTMYFFTKREGNMYFLGPNNKIRNITQLEMISLDIKK